MPQCVDKPNRHVDHEERDQEWLCACVLFPNVLERTPQCRNQKRRNKAQQIQRAPGSKPRNNADRDVEQQVVAEQGNVITRAGRHENRRCKRARKSDDRERLLVGQKREQCRERAHNRHQHESSEWRYKRVQLERSEDRQIEYRHARTLQQDCVV